MSFRSLLVALLLLTLPAAALAQDTAADRRGAAERYAQVSDLKKILADSYQAVAQNLPANRREEFVIYMNAAVDTAKLEAQMVDALVQAFTTDELNAMAAFWGSPQGQAIMQKYSKYMGVLMPAVQNEIVRAASTFK